jgi:hypothetical protein
MIIQGAHLPRYLAIALCFCGLSSSVHAQAGATSVQEALLILLREVARESAAACPAGPVLLSVTPSGAPTLLRQVFAEALMDRGVAVRTSGDGEQCRMNVDARGMYSSTVSAGNSSYLCKTVATLGILVEERSGRVAFARERSLERSDTLQGEAPFVYHSYLDESTSWWDGLLEPVLVTVTAVVIVVLLFTVRGSS